MNKMFIYLTCLLVLIKYVAAGTGQSRTVDSGNIPQNAASILSTSVEAGLHSMDPCHFDTINASIPNLNLLLRDVTLTGLKSCQFTQRSLELPKMNIAANCNMTFDGDYEGDGYLLSQLFHGKGRMHIDLNQIRLYGDVDIVFVHGKNGQTHGQLKNQRPYFELKENKQTRIDFENLFEGHNTTGYQLPPSLIYHAICLHIITNNLMIHLNCSRL